MNLNSSIKNKNIFAGVIGLSVIGIIFTGILGSNQQENMEYEPSNNKTVENKVTICNGTTVTKNCELDGVQYSLYKYYPPVEEKSHIETITTYKKTVVGYCTLCNDGTRSPSCSTGRGTCSHHGGVAQWNAPIYSEVPQYQENKVIDSPAVAERYEKIVKE